MCLMSSLKMSMQYRILLVESLGVDVGGRMHMGRSRNDEVATCIRIRLREDLLKQMSALLKVREVLVALAGLHIETVMPGFTHAACTAYHACPHLLAMNRHSHGTSTASRCIRPGEPVPAWCSRICIHRLPISREYTAGLLV